MNAEELASLDRARPEIVRNLNPTDRILIEYCLSEGILSHAEVDLIQNIAANNTECEAVQKFLSIYCRKMTSITPLIEAFKHCCYHNFVKELTEPGSVDTVIHSAESIKRQTRNVIALGGVPRKPVAYVERQELMENLRDALLDIGKSEDGWVVVHGMCGIGKSVLAAATLSLPEICPSTFTDVCWLDIGPHCDDDRLLAIMNRLFTSVDKAERRLKFESLTEITSTLQKALIYDCPSALVILDDVWTENVIHAFDDLRCRVLLTTRYKGLLDIICPRTIFVHVPDRGFGKDSALNVLAYWTYEPADHLPVEATAIYQRTGGHPFAFALIGSRLREHHEPNRWTYYLDLLRSRQLEEIKARSPYKYEHFVASANLSLDHLPSDLWSLFHSLAVFKRGVKIPAKVLALYWDMTEIQVEDTVSVFMKHSLISKSNPVSASGESYHLHVLVHDVITMLNGEETLKRLHGDLLDRYLEAADGQWAQLPRDGYIDQYIAYHLNRSKSPEAAREILVNLPFFMERMLQLEKEQVED